jgi:predicted ATP-grasp superfamily ATP-dependent carboligase
MRWAKEVEKAHQVLVLTNLRSNKTRESPPIFGVDKSELQKAKMAEKKSAMKRLQVTDKQIR